MREVGELAPLIATGEVFSEARAVGDFTAHGRITGEWIVSHEVLRRKARQVRAKSESQATQIEALNSQIIEKDKQIQQVNQDLYSMTNERDRIRKRLEKEVATETKYGDKQ